MKYHIDITKPPIFPPEKEFRKTLFGVKETKISKVKTKTWESYFKAYKERLFIARNERKERQFYNQNTGTITQFRGASVDIHVFFSKVRNEIVKVNWGEIKNDNKTDKPESYRRGFDNWIKACEPFVKKSSTVLDIGAYNGDTALPLAFLVGESGKVLAFEPNQKTYSSLSVNSLINPEVNLKTFNFGIAEESKEYNFRYQNNYTTGGIDLPTLITHETGEFPEKAIFKCRNLNDFLKEEGVSWSDINLIKTDIDGYDCELLWSLRNELRKHKPVIIIEWLPGYEDDLNEIKDFLTCKSISFETGNEIEIFPGEKTVDIILVPENL